MGACVRATRACVPRSRGPRGRGARATAPTPPLPRPPNRAPARSATKGCSFAVNNQLPKAGNNSGAVSLGGCRSLPTAIPSLHDHGVALVHFVAGLRLLLALCYDNALRAYDTDTGDLKFVQVRGARGRLWWR